MSTTNQRALGFTLPELIIGISVAGILLASALPALTGLVQRNRLEGAQQEFLTALAFTKQTAITNNAEVAMCPSSDSFNCLDDGLWHEGWIVFSDRNENRQADSTADILRIHGPLPDNITLTSSKYRRVIVFQPLGSAGGSNATFTFCDHQAGTPPKTVVLSVPGRVRWLETDDSASC